MRYVVGFLRFWRDFVVGDDWRIALGVVVSLAIGAVLVALAVGGEWLVPTLAMALIAWTLWASLARELRRLRRS